MERTSKFAPESGQFKDLFSNLFLELRHIISFGIKFRNKNRLEIFGRNFCKSRLNLAKFNRTLKLLGKRSALVFAQMSQHT